MTCWSGGYWNDFHGTLLQQAYVVPKIVPEEICMNQLGGLY